MSGNKILKATHREWCFRKEAFIHTYSIVHSIANPLNKPTGINFYPIATELFKFLTEKDVEFKILLKADPALPDVIDNPFTYDASCHAAIIAQILNDSSALLKNPKKLSPIQTELKCIRIISELTLYCVRLYEALIRQCLYCTTFPTPSYKTEALGKLISQRCESCKKENGKTPHNFSLLGSLAHRYSLCRPFDCVFPLLQKANKKRNDISAHAKALDIKIDSIQASLKRLSEERKSILSDLRHALDHLSTIELLMVDELEFSINSNDYTLFSKCTYYSDKVELGVL
ncbi:MAG: hypothetical protein COA46_03030 [Porticoccaceae bacterium]|nr:MAG: hypothetical protein COA46_03030 [Porticoccaceae bacterium]